MPTPTHHHSHFTLLDILRIISGLLLLNALLSYWFTASPTWGYRGKFLDPHYLAHRLDPFRTPLNLTLSELAQYDGTNKRRPIYVAVNGMVFDVSASPGVYGPGGPYHGVAGRDAARVFVTGCFRKKDEYTYDLRGLDEEEVRRDLKGWQEFFARHKRYWYVGVVQHEEIVGDVPEPCQHVKFPGMHS
ncbi:Membrane steroid-binding protein 1 [Candida viswanathii]|uniref:Membrane steroid-binding protein 1 n=1 Tax=Candida viswanathii TaxID=5486 RepID=A0A367XSG9_9ASCO|nr:Membrane steroid-binding protein 1 [Candida viswanathii]